MDFIALQAGDHFTPTPSEAFRRQTPRQRLLDRLDAGQDEVDAREELLAVVMPGQLRRDLAQERIRCGIELRPSCGNGRQKRDAIRLALSAARVGGILPGHAEDVVHERGPGVEPRAFGDAERLESSADALEDLQHRGSAGCEGELAADPRMRIEGIEHAKGYGPDSLPWRRRTAADLGHGTGDDMIRGSREQVVLVRHVPVDRSAPRHQSRRKGAKGQGLFAVGVKDLDRGLDDPLLGERVRPSFGPMVPGRHDRP